MAAPNQYAPPTLRIRRSDERGFEDFGWADNWMTFSFANYNDPAWVHFGPLRVMVENHIQPHEGFSAYPHRDVEILTYVVSGTLTHEDSFGHTRLASRRGKLCLYVSPDGRGETMPINTDACVYAGLFSPGDRITHKVEDGRGAWLQVVDGELEVAGETLRQGDGVGITGAGALTRLHSRQRGAALRRADGCAPAVDVSALLERPEHASLTEMSFPPQIYASHS